MWPSGDMNECGLQNTQVGVAFRRHEWVWPSGDMSGCGLMSQET